MANGISTLTTSTFDEAVLGSPTPVLVDFWAEWCGPCKKIAPVLEELAVEIGDQITIAKVNADENTDLTLRYNVMSIPTLLLFDGGELKHRIVGATGKGRLLEELHEFLATSR